LKRIATRFAEDEERMNKLVGKSQTGPQSSARAEVDIRDILQFELSEQDRLLKVKQTTMPLAKQQLAAPLVPSPVVIPATIAPVGITATIIPTVPTPTNSTAPVRTPTSNQPERERVEGGRNDREFKEREKQPVLEIPHFKPSEKEKDRDVNHRPEQNRTPCKDDKLSDRDRKPSSLHHPVDSVPEANSNTVLPPNANYTRSPSPNLTSPPSAPLTLERKSLFSGLLNRRADETASSNNAPTIDRPIAVSPASAAASAVAAAARNHTQRPRPQRPLWEWSRWVGFDP
jgi:hypothetical protein